MLGRRIELAKTLNMALPNKIREDLVEQRNAAIHRGTSVTGAAASAAIAVAWEVVDQYESLSPCCQEPAHAG